ncbi:tetraspanin-11 isoform X2 [Nilaparvata lugens]|uniref:tetraspanin-11 isoform X2 n=1 Tax=Nilaparvata lugens TaxID=108931 RepID=UPI00193CAF5C|nr:tetraspanin-11 isoform X2 [Nilaparvata lugens]XP_039295310.1 tetraspanin-11 isoform X2 [Nilaparvata lugens]XP_039295311.1 tetraspanin-11 isoform X2 [Nilaparvata lugens]XP_039295312.1 tetraspanin-11 isoform X2 [Nilaparvata lugens]XP_039295313.1 tetraspanin-11 isoform X2 [Nilaparvata lugens]
MHWRAALLPKWTCGSLDVVMGLGLMGCAMDILFDIERMLISRAVISSTSLPQPLYYYIALSLIAIGLFISSLSVLGCWATHCKNSCFIGLFMFLLVVMLVLEIVGCILMAVCPQMLGAHIVDEEILDNWQRNYGVPGREQFTAAVDLVQTKFECCGVQGAGDYSTTWWRLRELAAPDLLVPLSCCIQSDAREKSFLDPAPLNKTMCQDAQAENNELARFSQGCLTHLQEWLSHELNWA